VTKSKEPPYSWEAFGREVGLNLLQARKARGLTQERVAHAAGITAGTYQKFERGESRRGVPLNPRLATLIALSQVLGVSLHDLLPAKLPDVTAGY
jgi:transcriptional regulator with XRE-family HTH domain